MKTTYEYTCEVKACQTKDTQTYNLAQGFEPPKPCLPRGWITVSYGYNEVVLCDKCGEKLLLALEKALSEPLAPGPINRFDPTPPTEQ